MLNYLKMALVALMVVALGTAGLMNIGSASATDGYSHDPDHPSLVTSVPEGFSPYGNAVVVTDDCITTTTQVYSRTTEVPEVSHVETTYQRYSWNPKGPKDETDGPPDGSTPLTDPEHWQANTSHYNGTDPIGVVFQEGGGNSGDNASWFFWTADETVVVDEEGYSYTEYVYTVVVTGESCPPTDEPTPSEPPTDNPPSDNPSTPPVDTPSTSVPSETPPSVTPSEPEQGVGTPVSQDAPDEPDVPVSVNGGL